MEWALATFGGKFCCVAASTSIVVGWIAAEFLIPAAMSHWKFSAEVAVGIAFLIGYCGIRLLPKLEEALMNKVSK